MPENDHDSADPTLAIQSHRPREIARRSGGSSLTAPRAHEVIEVPRAHAALEPLARPPRDRLATHGGNGLDCVREIVQRGDSIKPDPRSYVEDYNPQILCCGQPVALKFMTGDDVTQRNRDDESDGEQPMIVEYIFHSLCAHCDTEGHHSFVRRVSRAEATSLARAPRDRR